MATTAPSFDLSLLPIFLARLRLLMVIVPTLRELPEPRLNELRSLLDRAEKLIAESMEGLISSNPHPSRNQPSALAP